MSGDDFSDRRTQRFEEAPQTRRLQAGDVIANRYEVEGALGEGGAGAVYKVRDRQTNRSVALKIVLPDRIARPGALEALAAEAAIARDIRHPSIVGVYDVRTETDPPFITMEFVAGRSLWSWMTQYRRERKPWPMATAASIVRAVLDGLAAAHEAGVVHRDIKPENILLTADPTPGRTPLKIIDFGIASAGATHAAGATEGTLAYMAPEGRYARDELGPSADLYSLSVIFYELLVAAPPQYWSPPSQGRADTPAAIDDLIREGLSPNALVRPQSAEAYRKRLEDALAAPKPEPAKAEPPAVKAREQTGVPAAGATSPLQASEIAGDIERGRKLEASAPEQARVLYLGAARLGSGEAMYLLGQMDRFGRGGPKNATASIAWYVKAGEAGYAEGDYMAGFALSARLRDWGGVKDPVKARYHYERAAKAGQTSAMMHLGAMLAEGQGGPKDRAGAKALFEAALKAGHPGAADSLKGFGL